MYLVAVGLFLQMLYCGYLSMCVVCRIEEWCVCSTWVDRLHSAGGGCQQVSVLMCGWMWAAPGPGV